ncbi:hypothetical protein LOZ35_003137 [Ophidiomyces ophidiicola]|nr:hypothetical protein LOZ35_003137 [Ophidiomyces ophidiicola]
MLVTPRTYRLSQTPNKGLSLSLENYPTFRTLRGWRVPPEEIRQAAEMLLIHQTGSVRLGEVVRYTLTYTPSADRILPHPTELFVKIKNTSAIALRAAYLHGPYTLHTSCYPSTFDPNRKFLNQESEGTPQFEPHLQPGAAWDSIIPVPEHLRDGNHPESESPEGRGVTWEIEISSQLVFSNTASVNFEVLVGRDLKSTELGATGIADLPAPGQLREHKRRSKESKNGNVGKHQGVYSESVSLVVTDTAALWTSPQFPSWDDTEALKDLEVEQTENVNRPLHGSSECSGGPRKRQNVHFVVLTHGLHSNVGADMLYMKESIDAAALQAREDRKQAREEQRRKTASATNVHDDIDDHDDELVVVRGFPGNAGRTERGIQYLGKRLAKYVLLMTYPDQPYLPTKSPRKMSFSQTFGFQKSQHTEQVCASHSGSAIYRKDPAHKGYAYQITSISFIGHSLGGLVQTYAIAYIQKHSPEFFDFIKPINFVALASPFLGLSNENPMYVKFALDFGLVGRTGQDLGLSWSSPSKMRSGWEAMIGGIGADANKSQPEAGAKPLLRILPSGPAHLVLKKFRNRTVYCNLVNDGIVPLRTSCLLFLDWRGLERVEKARRENGIVGTVAEWGWATLTGAASNPLRSSRTPTAIAAEEPQESAKVSGACKDPDSGVRRPETPELPSPGQFLASPSQSEPNQSLSGSKSDEPSDSSASPFNMFMALFKFSKRTRENKASKIYKRSQTIRETPPEGNEPGGPQSRPPCRTRGDSLYEEGGLFTPPKTTLFESAGDVISPPLPTLDYLLDPSSRPRTILHDRVYHPGDIPPPPPARNRSLFRTASVSSAKAGGDNASQHGSDVPSLQAAAGSKMSSGMKVEEKIARAYHRDISWRKVLVRLEPDAHNNIIVRRMFSNAYGWPVVKHLVDTHFAYTLAATTADNETTNEERALPLHTAVTAHGTEVQGQTDAPSTSRALRLDTKNMGADGKDSGGEENDQVPELASRLNSPKIGSPAMCSSPISLDNGEELFPQSNISSRRSSHHSKISRQSSAQWTDRYLDDGDEDEYSDEAEHYTELRHSFQTRNLNTSSGIHPSTLESPTSTVNDDKKKPNIQNDAG